MLTVERQEMILGFLKQKEVVSVREMVEKTGASESTIRRDLTEMESEQKIKRVHGGASLLRKKTEEPSLSEKTSLFQQEKTRIAKYAAEKIENGDCIYLDAGTTTMHMLPFLPPKIVVVTNGIPHVQKLMETGMETYVVGGKLKQGTAAVIGAKAIESIQSFRFDKCFLGINGIHLEYGYTTPDPEEAAVKQTAIAQAKETFVVADDTKFGDVSFAHVANIDQANIITSKGISTEMEKNISNKTRLEVV